MTKQDFSNCGFCGGIGEKSNVKQICKGCFNDLARHQRMPGRKNLSSKDILFYRDVERRIEESILRGGYVPTWITRPIRNLACEECGAEYQTIYGPGICNACKRRQTNV